MTRIASSNAQTLQSTTGFGQVLDLLLRLLIAQIVILGNLEYGLAASCVNSVVLDCSRMLLSVIVVWVLSLAAN